MRQISLPGPGHITRYRTKFRLVAMATCLPRLYTPGPHLACFRFVRMQRGRAMIPVGCSPAIPRKPEFNPRADHVGFVVDVLVLR